MEIAGVWDEDSLLVLVARLRRDVVSPGHPMHFIVSPVRSAAPGRAGGGPSIGNSPGSGLLPDPHIQPGTPPA
jgi:hypothetical protein